MTLNKKLQNGVALSAAVLALMASPAKGQIVINQPDIGNIGGQINAGVNYTNNATGVSFDSLQSDSQWFDMWKQAYGVSDVYTTDADLANSGLIGYNISSGSQVGDGWFTTQNANGTVSYDNIGGRAADDFSTNKTLSGNFFAGSQLNDMDNDGLANYDLKFLDDLTTSELNNPLTIIGAIGANNGGYSIFADAGINSTGAIGNQYALVPTANYPIPEPSTYALITGAAAGAGALIRRRRKALYQG